ncbi:MAG: T9SS type A sorting domain-containing protein [Bacteroidetes bacterium]|nr:T9SS type A sorting domain-containing protein [Bacteroidota bacterium]
MKKIYTFLLILTIVGTSLFAQTLQLQTLSGTVIPNGGTVGLKWPMAGDTTTDVFLELKQKNISTGTQNYKVMKVVKSLADSQKAYFCFAGGCFSDTTIISPTTLMLTAGQEDNNFSGHITPNKHRGSSVVYYKFYNTRDANDTVGIYIQTEIWGLGVSDLSNTKPELGLAFPNPANEKATVDYSLNTEGSARLVLQNVLGTPVREETVSGGSGQVKFNVSALPEGVYVYSLIVNGKIVSSRKLLVKH